MLILGIVAVSGFTLFSGQIAQTRTKLFSKADEIADLAASATELKAIGLIDATNPPAEFNLTPARGDGSTDDTVALQNIINYAFYGTDSDIVNAFNQVDPDDTPVLQGRYAVILPGDDGDSQTPFKGEYLVTDTLVMFQNSVREKRKGKRAHILIGSTNTTKRAIIRLREDSPKFQAANTNAPLGESKTIRPVIMISANAATTDRGSCENADVNLCNYLKSGDNFEQKIKNITIEIVPNNPRAVGLNFAGAQHSAIEDVTINIKSGPRSGFAGFDGLPGVSSIATNIEVIGGKYGFYGEHSDDNAYALGQHKVLAVTNVKFINQSEAAIYKPKSLGSLSLVGFEIRKNTGPAIVTNDVVGAPGSVPLAGATSMRSEIALIDGIIEFIQSSTAPAIDNSTGKGTSITNVYFKNIPNIIKTGSGSSANILSTNPVGFSRVTDYAVQNTDYTDGIVFDGSIQNIAAVVGAVQLNQNPQQDQLLKSHTWSHTNYSFDHWYELSKDRQENQVCNALDVNDSYQIRGNGSNDDTNGLQAMINDVNCKVVIFPRGTYMLSNTLNLKQETRLIGLNISATTLKTMAIWKPTTLTPVIRTVDSATATTTVEDLQVAIATDSVPPSASSIDWFIGLDWRAGRGSMVKNYYTDPLYSLVGGHSNPKPQDRISGNGGGKWFAYDAIAGGSNRTQIHAQNRKLLVENTTEPLNFYNVSMEDCQAFRADPVNGYQAEFKNAKNIAVYGTKNENCNPYAITNGSDNIFFFGLGKSSMSFNIVNSNNILFKTFSPQQEYCSAPGFSSNKTIIQRDNGNITVQKLSKSPLAYYRKGNPDRTRTLIPVTTGPVTPTPTGIPTATPLVTNTPTPTGVPTNTPTILPTSTRTPTPIQTGTLTPTRTPTPTLVTTFTPTPTEEYARINLIQNASFERGLNREFIPSGNATMTHAISKARNGVRSLLIISTDSSRSRRSQWSSSTTLLPVTQSEEYSSNVWVDTKNMNGSVEYVVMFFRQNGQYMTAYFSDEVSTNTNGWKKMRIDSVRSPVGAAYAVVEMRLWGEGRVWFDNVSFFESP